jgi:hypothetical protein
MSHSVVWLTANKKFLYQGFLFIKNSEGQFQGTYNGKKKLSEAQQKELEEASFPNEQVAARAAVKMLDEIEE